MNTRAITPYLFLASLYALIACFIHACFSLWYSGIPERVQFLQYYLDSIGEVTAVVVCILGVILVLVGGIVLFVLKLIDKTWLVVYCIVPPLIGFLLSQVIYLVSF